ncbi:phytoene desaturase family protein [Sporanaerobium hydrogeniformans]|uniref:phytoene desaturase family protein n=1 Tax=Sporanaerobium hydrogeniformans TaxID=3072179 RepID=UPI0015D5194A|nr:NAD(P)/FAD-dependent oxidoreductase [Sporanaerobium hydrogeniformans]
MKKMVIIGGGIAGLSAGIFAQENGFESIIFEKNHTMGGQCTGWNRKGYHIDNCIHWLTGSRKGSLNELWREVGALSDEIEIFYPERFYTVEYQGVQVSIYRDIERTQKELLQLSPEDEKAIKEMCEVVRILATVEMPTEKPMEDLNLFDFIKLAKSMGAGGKVMMKYAKLSMEDYANTFKHPAIRHLILDYMPERYNASSYMFSLATFCSGNGGIPKGGSVQMVQRMVDHYLSLGGKIKKGYTAKQVHIQDGKAVEVEFENGDRVGGDAYILTMDSKVAFSKLIGEKYMDKPFRTWYENPQLYPVNSAVNLSFGVADPCKDIPETLFFDCEGYQVGCSVKNRMSIKNYNYDEFGPEGHVVLQASFDQVEKDYVFWKDLYKDKASYEVEKKRIAQDAIERMEVKFPQLKGKIQSLDVVTPVSYEKWCGAYKGAYMSFIVTKAGKQMQSTGKIKGLDNVVLAGQWLMPPGGLPTAVVQGKFGVMRLMKKLGFKKD